MTEVRIRGTPRSLQEMDFVANAHACSTCGDWRRLSWKNGGTGSTWRTHAKCPVCSTERVYLFTTDEDLIEVMPPSLELGPGTSSVLTPRDLVIELERLGPDPAGDWDRWERQVIALNELAKFIPAGAAAIPVELQDTSAAPAEHYTRAWIESERARLGAMMQRR